MVLSEVTKELAKVNQQQLEIQAKISKATAIFQSELKRLQDND